jgi:hypothetical protein
MLEISALRTGTKAVPVALWMGIMTALVIEAFALIVRTALGDFTTFSPYLADLSRVAMRATIVGGAIALALVGSPGSVRPYLCALAGLAFGPVACMAGRAVAATLRSRMGLPAASSDPQLLMVLGGVRSLEFGTLGFLVGFLATKRASSASFALAGAGVAVVFGIAIVAVRHEAVFGALSTADVLAYAIEELAFPVAIALILAAVTRIVETRAASERLVPAKLR